MSKAFIDDTHLTDIADAIRAKLGVSTQYLPSEMAGAILSIPKSKVVDFNVSSITLNGAKANSLQYVKAYGKCEQNGTPTPTSPVDIVCNNGVLRVSVNEFDVNTITRGYFYNTDLEWVANSSVYITDYMKTVKGKYTLVLNKIATLSSIVNIRINLFNANKEIQSQTGIPITPDTTEYTYEVDIPDGISYVRVSTNPVFVVVSGFSNSKTIYTDGTVETIEDTIGNTATTEMLLKVGDYQDEQEILSGIVNRKIGVKVFNGSESWNLGGNNTGVWRTFGQAGTFDITDAICGHFQYTTGGDVNIANMLQDHFCLYSDGNLSFKSSNTTDVNTWKEWLQTQYNNGTPVIVVYLLATATTESVAGQTLQVQAGDNTLEITQSALSGLEVECEYFLQ